MTESVAPNSTPPSDAKSNENTSKPTPQRFPPYKRIYSVLPKPKLPLLETISPESKLPMVDNVKDFWRLTTTKLGTPLNMPKKGQDFDLTDPLCRYTDFSYKALNDPALKKFFNKPSVKAQLLKNGLITKEDKVTCSLKEFNNWRFSMHQSWLRAVQSMRRQQTLREKVWQMKETTRKIKEKIANLDTGSMRATKAEESVEGTGIGVEPEGSSVFSQAQTNMLELERKMEIAEQKALDEYLIAKQFEREVLQRRREKRRAKAEKE